MLIWKLAWRNIQRHKAKSFVVGIILFLGMLLMTVGNAVIEGTVQGMLDNIVARFSGDIAIVSTEQKFDDLFFPPHPVESIATYPEIKTILGEQAIVERFMPIARGPVMLLSENGVSTSSMVFGVKFDEYRRFFDESLELVEGQWPAPGEPGILISDKNRETLFNRQRSWIVPEGAELIEEHLLPRALEKFEKGTLKLRSDVVLLGQSGESLQTDIRIPVKGIYRFKQLNTVWGNMYNFIDIESYRETFGHVLAGDRLHELSAEYQAILTTDMGDDMFAEGSFVEDAELSSGTFAAESLHAQTRREDTTETPIDLDTGIYSIIMIKLKDGVNLEEARAIVESAVTQTDLGVRVLTWPQMLADLAEVSSIAQGALFLFVMFVFFVAVIIIMNTLSMAALERSAEIGMMRAIGARKGFVSKLFLAETAQLALVFGGAGILCGMLLVWGLAAMNIPVGDNDMLGLLFGGDTFHPIIQSINVSLGFVQLAIVTLLSVMYPLAIARRITPLEAVLRD